MDVGPGMMHEAVEEIFYKFRLQVAHEADSNQIFENQRRTAAQINRNHSESLIHRLDKVSCTIDASPVAERLRKELAQDDAHIFHCVMLIDVEIAGGFQLQVEAAVLGEQLQHVIEEADAGGDFVAAAPFERQAPADLRFFRIAFNGRASHRVPRTSSI